MRKPRRFLSEKAGPSPAREAIGRSSTARASQRERSGSTVRVRAGGGGRSVDGPERPVRWPLFGVTVTCVRGRMAVGDGIVARQEREAAGVV